MSRLANLWEETAVVAPRTAPLDGPAGADVVVIGAGYLGLSAALHIAETGRSAVVLEAHMPGYGASGRNGGQLIPGLKCDPDDIEAVFGRERGEKLWRFAGGTADLVFGLVKRFGLEAQARRTAWIQGVHSRKAEKLAGCIRPLSYARELARAAISAGARVHGRSQVVSLAKIGDAWKATTSAGIDVTAGKVLLCANAYSDALVPELPRSIVAAPSMIASPGASATGLI